MNRIRLLTLSCLAAAAFVPRAAHGQLLARGELTTGTGTLTTGTVVQPETVIDLGAYDPAPAPHPAYAIVKAPPATLLVMQDEAPASPSASCPAPTATYDWDRVFSKSDEFGNSTFGAGYWAGLTFSSRAGRAGGPDSFTGEAMAKAYATVFGADKEIAKISGKASLVGTQGTSSYYVRVLGADVRSRTVSGNLDETAPIYNATIFSNKKTIWLGPVPVSFKGAVKGSLGIDYRALYATSTLYGEAKPVAKLYATASAGVDMWLASAGVTGTLDLVKVEVPSKASAVVSPSSVTFGVDSDLVLSSLSGRIDAYATLPGKRWTMNLAKWDPLFKGTYPIVHARACTNPIVRPVCGDGVCQSGETSTNCSTDCGAPPPPPPDEPTVPLYCISKPWMCSDF